MRRVSRKVTYGMLFGILLVSLLMELFIAYFIEKPQNIKNAEEKGFRAVLDIKNEELLTHDFSLANKESILQSAKRVDTLLPSDNSSQISVNPTKKIKPKILMLIKNLGMDSSSTMSAMNLPVGFCLGFSPYSYNLDEFMTQASNKNFTVLLNLPMELSGYPADDPGSKALITDLSLAENLRRLNIIITSSRNYDLYTDEGEKFTYSIQGVKNLIKILSMAKKNLLYGGGDANALFMKMASKSSFTSFPRDLTIDDVLNIEAIETNLTQLETLAQKRGYAIGYANPYPITINKLNEWQSTLNSKGIELTTLQELREIYSSDAEQRGRNGN